MTDEVKKAYAKALGMLSACDQTPRRVYEKLCERMPDADKEDLKTAVKTLIAEGKLDEKRYGERVIELAKRKLYGERRIVTELENKKFTRSFIEKAIPIIASDEHERAFELFSKKMESFPADGDTESVNGFMKKAYAYMARMGYSSDSIRSAMERYRKEE